MYLSELYYIFTSWYILIPSLIILVIYLSYVYSLYVIFDEIDPYNQAISPSQIWLLLIPIFANFYIFKVVKKLSDSIRYEFDKRGIESPEIQPGYRNGLIMASFWGASFLAFKAIIPAIIACSFGIKHWRDISFYHKLLRSDSMKRSGELASM